MLLNTPIDGMDEHELGVDMGASSAPLPALTEQRANAAVYIACLFVLQQGRRDLLPLAWAWASCSIEQHFQHYDPDRPEKSNPTTARESVEWAVEFCGRVVDKVFEHKINPLLRLTIHDEQTINLLTSINAIADGGKKYVNKYNAAKDGCVVTWLADKTGASAGAIGIMGFITARSNTASHVCMLCQQAAAEYVRDEPNMAMVDAVLREAGIQGDSAIPGMALSNFPRKLMLAFADMRERENVGSMGTVWESLLSNLYPKKSNVECPEPKQFTSGMKRRNHRWRNGRIDQELADVREVCNFTTLPMAAKAVNLALRNNDTTMRKTLNTFFSFGKEQAEIALSKDAFQPVTFMQEDAYEAFQLSGSTKDMWQLIKEGGQTWHHRFSDDPTVAKAVVDMKLWGEKASPIVYGALVDLGDYAQLAALGRMYGTKAVVWDFDVLEAASTLTLNESNQAPFALPATPENVIKALVPYLVGRDGAAGGKALCAHNPGPVPHMAHALFGSGDWINFIEVQIHDTLTKDDVVRVFDVEVAV